MLGPERNTEETTEPLHLPLLHIPALHRMSSAPGPVPTVAKDCPIPLLLIFSGPWRSPCCPSQDLSQKFLGKPARGEENRSVQREAQSTVPGVLSAPPPQKKRKSPAGSPPCHGLSVQSAHSALFTHVPVLRDRGVRDVDTQNEETRWPELWIESRGMQNEKEQVGYLHSWGTSLGGKGQPLSEVKGQTSTGF